MTARTNITAKEAAAKGYAIISREFGHASRIDREDWRDYLAANNALGTNLLKALGERAADQYRRCYSQDVIDVPKSWVKVLPNSSNGPTEFIDASA